MLFLVYNTVPIALIFIFSVRGRNISAWRIICNFEHDIKHRKLNIKAEINLVDTFQ